METASVHHHTQSHHDKHQLVLYHKPAIVLSTVAYVCIVLALIVITSAPPMRIIIGSLPLLAYIITFFVLTQVEVQAWLHWALPPVYAGAFYMLWLGKVVPIMHHIEGNAVTVLNLLACYVVSMILVFVFGIQKQKVVVKRKVIHKGIDNKELHELEEKYKKESHAYQEHIKSLQHELQHTQHKLINQTTFRRSLRGIEDKCKAINFVIGRVYGNKKGGSPEAREKIVIPREIYNAFSELSGKLNANFTTDDAHEVYTILQLIYHHLTILEAPEKLYFTLDPLRSLKLIRDSKGETPILRVLARNDKDPILDYHAEAKEVCLELAQFIRKKLEE